MKKENKKMAQERRARERRKKEIQRKISKTIVILIPLIAVIALFIAIAITSADSASDTDTNTDTATDSSTDTDTTADNSTDTDNDSAGYSTDASLTVEDGDTVNIDYVGSVDGVEFEGGSTQGQGTDLVIGSGSYIDDFEEQLIGAHPGDEPGDEVDVYATFPDPYNNNPDLSGKEALFEVTINGIYE